MISLAWLVRLAEPWWLLLAVAAAGPVLFAARARRRRRQLSTWNVVLQCASLLTVALAVAGPSISIGPRARKGLLVLRDVSASCRGQPKSPPPLPEHLPVEPYDFAAGVWPAGRDGDANTTDIAPALRLALARRDGLAGVLVQTDGRFLDGDWRAPAAALGEAGLPVTIVPLDSPPADARVAELSAERHADGRVLLRVTVAANALMRRTLRLRRTFPAEADLLPARELDLLPGRAATLRATDTPPVGGLASYRAELSPADAFAENDDAEAVVLPSSRRVAAVGAGPLSPGALAGALGLPVEQLPPDAAPRTADGWMSYAAVLLVDPNGLRLPPAARAALEQYVRIGGGLVLLGAGPHASPGDRDDPLNRASALIANPYQRRPLHLAVVLDASGSMAEPAASAGPPAGRIKFDQATEAVLGLRRHLTPADRMSVIVFSDSARRVYDSGGAEVDFAAVRDALVAVRPAGPTDVSGALELAASAPPQKPREGLVLVVSDLLTRPFRADRAAEAFRKAKLSLAVVAIADTRTSRPAEVPLETLARLLGAPVVRREGLAGLAKVFAGLLRKTRGSAVRAGRFQVRAGRAAFGRPPGDLPEVTAYLLCAAQPGAEVLASVGPESDPLLAVRRVGLGRAAGLALLAADGHNPAWQGSGEWARLLPAAVRWALRPAGDPRFAGTVRADGESVRVELNAADANAPVNLLELTGRLVSPGDGDAVRSFAFTQIAPGRYEARLRDVRRPAGLTVTTADGREVWQDIVARGAPRELTAVGPDWANLRLLAELTGGQIASGRGVGARAERLFEQGHTPLWPGLLAVAGLLMLAEWAGARTWHRKG